MNSQPPIRLAVCATVVLVACCLSSSTAAERVVLMRNGSLLRGDVSRTATHITIRSPNSRLRIPVKDVELVANSLSDAFRRQRRMVLRDDSSPARAKLIRWCLQNGLRNRAADELEELRRRDPGYRELEYLAYLQQATTVGVRATRLPPPAGEHHDVAAAKPKLDQLSAKTVAEFTRRVQPLMSNRCATAGCHARKPKSSFHFIPAQRGVSHRNVTRRNLSATLQQMNTASARQSVLWMSAASAHGPLTEPAMSTRELQTLFTWIQRVNQDLGMKLTQAEITAQRKASLPQELKADPFDPNEFNTRYR